ncbi:MAG: hypothetical protein SFY32_02445 [Bacteroidota bacterium]|nr:hypothetical protein [Bacteroidota bacterium]
MFSFLLGPGYAHAQKVPDSIYDLSLTSLTGEHLPLSNFKGTKMMFVTTQTKSSLSYQIDDMVKLCEKYSKVVKVFALPLDIINWNKLEDVNSLSNAYYKDKKANFTVLHNTPVKGADIHPVVQWITNKKYNKVKDFGIKNLFQKFIINEYGKLLQVFDSQTDIFDNEVVLSILKESPNIQQATVDLRKSTIDYNTKAIAPLLNKNTGNTHLAPWM